MHWGAKIKESPKCGWGRYTLRKINFAPPKAPARVVIINNVIIYDNFESFNFIVLILLGVSARARDKF